MISHIDFVLFRCVCVWPSGKLVISCEIACHHNKSSQVNSPIIGEGNLITNNNYWTKLVNIYQNCLLSLVVCWFEYYVMPPLSFLESQDLPGQPPLEFALGQAFQCLGHMFRNGLGSAAFTGVQDIINSWAGYIHQYYGSCIECWLYNFFMNGHHHHYIFLDI